MSHAMVARGVESHLFSLVRGAVQALYLLASAVLYGVELKLLRACTSVRSLHKINDVAATRRARHEKMNCFA